MRCAMLVNDRSECKTGRGRVEGGIKGVMGRCAQATDPAPATGDRRAHTGRPAPGARADQNKPRP